MNRRILIRLRKYGEFLEFSALRKWTGKFIIRSCN